MKEETLLKGIEIKKDLDQSRNGLKDLKSIKEYFMKAERPNDKRYFDVSCKESGINGGTYSVRISKEAAVLAVDKEIEILEKHIKEQEIKLQSLKD